MFTTLSDVFKANNENDVNFLKFCFKSNILCNQQKICPRCGYLMKIYYSQSFTDGGAFRCSNSQCRKFLNIRHGTVFLNSHFTLKQLLMIYACWCANIRVSHIATIMGIRRTENISKFVNKIRLIAQRKLLNDLSSFQLGGNNIIVQIDESLFGRAKYNRGKNLKKKPLWVFGIVDCHNSRVFMKIVKDRSESTLLPIVISYVNNKSLIYSDSWSSYNNLYLYGYRHYKVNHSTHFVHPISGAHTQKIESLWRSCKDFIRQRRPKSRANYELLIHEWCYRHNNSSSYSLLWKTLQ